MLIVYGSFYPWHFQRVVLPANPLWILTHSRPVAFDLYTYRDAAINLALYVPCGMFGFLSLSESRSRAARWAEVFLGAAALSACIEMVQLFIPGRVCSMFDLTCNVAGASMGILLAATCPLPIHRALRETEAVGAFRWSGAMVLLYVWAGYLLFPFFPALSRSALYPKLMAFLSPGNWALRDFLESLGGWLAVAALLESLAGRKRAARLLPFALLLIPAKLVIVHRSMSGSELAGALTGIGCWMCFRRLWQPRLAAGVLALAALVASGLAPFQFTLGRPQSFTWVPFLPMLQAPWESAFIVLLRKTFLYGSAIWLLHSDGRGWWMTSLIVAIPLALVEALQVFLPGRTPELTDPALALLVGIGLMLLERHETARLPRST